MNARTYTAAIQVSWSLIYTGQRIIRFAERVEGAVPYTARTRLAWRIITLGEWLERAGEALEANVERRALEAGFDMQDILAPAVAARLR